ncbi:MAG: endonuclease/exonuclease/phosphatase family protein [Bacteroidaceae bacterium]|nr:endonuclease/exonuclease/phosphatase family protein [Bacteroidaceae bacterium]
MKLLKTIPLILFIAINLFVIVAMNFCAYTSCLPPQHHAHLSYFGLMFPVFLVSDAVFVVFWLIFKWRLTVLPLMGMLLCADSVRAYFPLNVPTDVPSGSIKILSYNVMAFGKDTSDEWGKNNIMNYLMASGADVICLQEARKSLIDACIDSVKTLYPYYKLELRADNYMICFSKFPIDSIAMIDYPTETNYSFVYNIMVGEDTLMLINNHLESYRLSPEDKEDYKSIIQNYRHPEQNGSEMKYMNLTGKLAEHDSIRGMQTDSVAAFVERHEGCYIVTCGDFNASPISYTHHRLTQCLDDAYTRTGNGAGTSYNRSGMYFRLDHIFVTPNIMAYGARVDKSIDESDHYPIYCYIKLGEK